MLSLLQPSFYLTLVPVRVTSPAPVFPTDHIMDDMAAQPSCPEVPSLENFAVMSADPPLLAYGDHCASDRRPPVCFVDYDTEL